MTKKMKLFIYLSVLCAIILSTVYYITNKNFQVNNQPDTINVQKTIDNTLEKNAKVSLFSKGKIENEYTLDEIKEELNVKEDLSKSKLIDLLKDKGYNFEAAINNELIFKKTENAIKPNKYYIGEKDGFLAIYKSDNDGKLQLEKENDVYRQFKPVSSLSKIDKEKIQQFKLVYSSKEEAEENISEFLS